MTRKENAIRLVEVHNGKEKEMLQDFQAQEERTAKKPSKHLVYGTMQQKMESVSNRNAKRAKSGELTSCLVPA
jgi:hypothetical protein